MLANAKLKNKIVALTIFNFLSFTVFSATLLFLAMDNSPILNKFMLGGSVLLTILAIISTQSVTKSINTPLSRMHMSLQKIISGDIRTRTAIKSKDELGYISQAIDKIIHEHMVSMSKIEEENESLNDSIISLLETVTQLSQKNLTVKAKVNADVSGPIADALNILSLQTSSVLRQVMFIAEEVAETSNLVKSEADNVILLANNERDQVEHTVTELKFASDTMVKINKLAENSNIVATNAIETTTTAMNSVKNTVDSINAIKDRIRETEKRTKRLGERSQEISTAVNLVNNISERTHILALNASMHAASAGEAGRGFAIVADEVQRLAESSREATSEIAVLVKNIQLETSDAMQTMNELISQVVESDKLARQANHEMEETQSSTVNLVDMVKKISQDTSMQNELGRKLRERADIIRKSVRKTGNHLNEQTVHTNELVQQALSLVAAISVFTLDEDELLQDNLDTEAMGMDV